MKRFSSAGLALLAAAHLFAQAPAIAPGGIVRQANRIPTTFEAGRLAPGVQIRIPGIRFEESDTRIVLEKDSWHATITPDTFTPTLLTATLPAGLPSGDVSIAVETSQGRSRAEIVPAAASSPAIVTLNGEGWGPAHDTTVRRGQKIRIRVDGLHEPRPKVFIGGVQARRVSVRGQEVAFIIPRNAPVGCWTPFWIESATGGISNFATLPVAAGKGECEQQRGWVSQQVSEGSRNAVLILSRVSGMAEIVAGRPQEFGFDSGAAFVYQAAKGNPVLLQLLPAAGTCTNYAGTFVFDPRPFFSLQGFMGPISQTLSPGSPVRVGNGIREAELDLDEGLRGFYTKILGGVVPVIWGPRTPLFFDPGTYKVATGGFQATVPVPPRFTWQNAAQLSEIDRKAGYEFTWNGLDADRQMAIVAFSVDQNTSAMGTVVCLAPPGAARFKIPPAAMSNFPATQPASPLPLRLVMLLSMPLQSSKPAEPVKDFDSVRAMFIEVQARTVKFR